MSSTLFKIQNLLHCVLEPNSKCRPEYAGIGAGIEASDDDGWEVGTDSPRYLYGAPRVTWPRHVSSRGRFGGVS